MKKLIKMKLKNKKTQEEMIGFVLIVVLVSVILLILLMIYLNKDNKEGNMENLQIEGYLTSLMQLTTNCSDYEGYNSVKDLIYMCLNGEKCLNEESSCNVLKNTIESSLEETWKLKNRPEKGYDFIIKFENQTKIGPITKGNSTNNYIGALKSYSKSGQNIDITLKVYY